MKIIDGFIFYNELDLLTYRLNILNDVVDYFIIVESTHTHVGNPKPLFFEENKQMFVQFSHKIIHIIVDDFPFKAPNINYQKSEQWVNENFQRSAIQRGIDKIQLADEDCIMISDLDEIPDPSTLRKIKSGQINVSINKLLMDFYYYNLTSKMEMKWNLLVILTFGLYKQLNLNCNQLRQYRCGDIEPGGWHLSYFGDTKFIKNKIEQFGHVEFNRPEITAPENIEASVKNSSDVFHRKGEKMLKIPISDNRYLPLQYEIYLSKFLG
jgi:beta-1,4-mannosyl-glycoprotein beta-1,4-N-acetylglucosaminyltransferase